MSSFHQVLPCLWSVSSSLVAPGHLQLEEHVYHIRRQCSVHSRLWGSLSTAMACPWSSLVKITRTLAGLISPAALRTEMSNCPSALFPAEKEFGGELTPGDLATWWCPCLLWGLVFPVQTPGVHEQVSWTEFRGHCPFHLSLHAFGPRPSGVRFSKAWPVTSLGHSPQLRTAMRTGGRHPEYPELRFFVLPFPSSGLWEQSPCLPLSVTGDASFRWKSYSVRRYRDW